MDMTKLATFAAGCFWGVEEAFLGSGLALQSTSVGYSGGVTTLPTYQDVCTGKTGHAEAVQIQFDPSMVSFGQLLDVFWKIHDPTTKNRQGPDVGTQYRSVIFCHDQEQMQAARQSMESEQSKHANDIVTEITMASPFYRAEDYHQKYLRKHGQSVCHLI